MSSHQIHFGRKFYQDKKRGYWISTDYPRIRAHQWIWINHWGKPPKGYHIHHVNEDKSDNRIENLELIKAARHLKFHMLEYLKNPLNKKRCQENCEKIRPLTKAWHGSEEGRAWHKFHALKSGLGKWKPSKYICQQCNKEYESIKKSRALFCCNSCKSKWRRQSGLDDIYLTCGICFQSFKKNKYSKQKYCSKKCGGISRKIVKFPI
jgi:hypothetical protein